ncbi:MAG: tetratricopeptide repeat protein [Deltaproteobacteria bacterium]|nr:tetratricopeptide repeat protein [Deltaproteobacteria bacterium]
MSFDARTPIFAGSSGFSLDVWASAQTLAELRSELAAQSGDRQRDALIAHEIARLLLANGEETAAAQQLLLAHRLAPRLRPTLRLAHLLYYDRGDLDLAAQLLAALTEATSATVGKLALARRHAALLWSGPRRGADAFEILQRNLRQSPGDLTTLVAATLVAHPAGLSREQRQRSALALHGAVTDDALSTAIAARIAVQMGDDDPATAIRLLESVADANDPAVLVTLELLYERQEAHAALVETLERQAQADEVEAAWRAQLWARTARIHRDQLSDKPRAIAAFSKSWEARKDYGTGWELFELLYGDGLLDQAVEIATTLHELDHAPQVRADLSNRVGDMLRDAGKTNEAIEWYQRCLADAPSYQLALASLSALLESRSQIDALLRIHIADVDNAQSALQKAHGVYRAAALLESSGRFEQAAAMYGQALDTIANFLPALAALERLLTRLQRWDELAALLHHQLKGLSDVSARAQVLDKLATLYQHRLSAPDRAADCYEQLLKIRPDHLPTIRAMARVCALAERWEDLVQLNGQELALVDQSARKAELYFRSGEILEHKLLDLDRALDSYQAAWALDSEHLPTLRALGRIFRQRGRWEDLAEMHEAEINASTDRDHIVALLCTQAEIYEQELLDEQRAIESLRRALDHRSNSVAAHCALARLYERQHRWSDLAALWEGALDSLKDPAEQALQLWRIGELRARHLGDTAGAVRDYTRALRLDRDLAPARFALAELLELTEQDREPLLELLKMSIDRSTDEVDRAELCENLGDLLRQDPARASEATANYERATSIAPSIIRFWVLAELYREQQRVEDQCRALSEIGRLVAEERDAAEIQLKVAILKHDANYGSPVANYQQALTLRSGGVFAQRRLENYIRGTTQPSDDDSYALGELLLSRIERTSEAYELACLWSEFGDLAVQRADVDTAFQAYREALEHRGDHLPAIWALQRLRRGRSEWTELCELTEREAQSSQSPTDSASALLEAAALSQYQLSDAERASQLYQRALQQNPGDRRAFDALRNVLFDSERWNDLAALIREQIGATEDDREAALLFGELGRIYVDQLGQTNKGVACLRRVLKVDPYDGYALAVLATYHDQRQQPIEAAQLYSRLELVAAEKSEREQIRRRLGQLYLDIGEPRKALAAFGRALEGNAAHDPDLLARIVEAARAAHDPQAQIAALESLAEHADDATQRISARKQLADVASEQLEDDGRAAEALLEVLALDPLDIDATEKLAAIYGRSGNRSAAAQHLRAAVAHHRAALEQQPENAALYRQLARLFRWQRQYDRLYCACTVLAHAQAIDDIEAQFWREHHGRCGQLSGVVLERRRFERVLLPPEIDSPLRDLMRELAPLLAKASGATAERYGLRNDGASLDRRHPFWRSLSDILAVFSHPEIDVQLSETDPSLIVGEFLPGPTLIVGSRVIQGPLREIDRFRIGHALLSLVEHCSTLLAGDWRKTHLLLNTLGSLAQPPYAGNLSLEEQQRISATQEEVSRRLSRRDRRGLSSVFERYSGGLTPEMVHRFASATARAANRAGLICCGDPLTALEEVSARSGRSNSTPVTDLFTFIVSEEHFALRVELGLAPGSR